MTTRLVATLALSIGIVGCNDAVAVDSHASALQGGGIASQLRGYDLGPPFPAGFRDSGLVNGYAEGEWVPFVAIMEGKQLEDADKLAGTVGDGRFGAAIIVPTYSPRHDANSISDLQTTGTYGQGAIAPIPNPFDDRWLHDHGYAPFVLGAYADTGDVDLAPALDIAAQRSGPRRFGGDVGSVSVPISFVASTAATRVELRFAVRLAPRSLAPIQPGGQAFPGLTAGTAKGAADFFPGPGPIFVGYEVDTPTGIATVPIRVERHTCDSDTECPPGETCGDDHTCSEPCTDDSSCSSDEVCEDGQCRPPPPACVETADCDGELTCVGGYCVPPCPPGGSPDGGDPIVCNPGDGQPPCVRDNQCNGNNVCEDGVCQPCEHPCDVSCRSGLVCRDGFCEEPEAEPCRGNQCPDQTVCTTQYDCAGGELCENGVCAPGGGTVDTCATDADCPSGSCVGGVCASSPIQRASCTASTVCAAGHDCIDGECTRRPGICELDGDCAAGESCLAGWCGRACTGDASCEGSETCRLGRCVDPCTSVATCALGDACIEGGCIPEFAFIGHPGGDQSLWDVGFEQADSGGGCSTTPGSSNWLVALFALGLVARTRRRFGDIDRG